MSITDTIAANLTEWMAKTPNLDTIKKVSGRSGVGFGTVRRIKNGDGNPTINNLADIARVFGKHAEDLLAPPAGVTRFEAAEPEPAPYQPLIKELVAVASSMSERGQIELIGRAKEMALHHPAAKANRAN